GARNGLWLGLLVVAVLAVVAGAIFVGRWLRPKLARDRFLLDAPGWAALAMAVLLAGGAFVLGGRTSAQAQAPNAVAKGGNQDKPNVLVIVMDTVRADHLSLYGYERDTSPNLKKLAADSVVYTQTMAPSDMTLTSHASLFTGLYATWHGAYCQPPEAAHGRVLNPGATTLAETLSAKGYSTLGVAANLYLRADFGLQRGFQNFRIPRPVPVLGADESWYLLRIGMRRLMNLVVNTSQFDRLFTRGDDINQELYKVMEAQGRAPFFAFVNYMDAHFPYIPPAPFDRLFPGKDDKLLQGDLEEAQERVMRGKSFKPSEYNHLLSQYDGGIAYTDAQIGKMMDWLKQRDLYDNTLIVVTSDHGEAFGERNLVLHGNSVYQNLLHVALLIKYPKKAATGVVSDPVSLIDIAPTILTAAGVPVDSKIQGRNLLANASMPKRDLFSESFPCPVPHPPECILSGCTSRALLTWPYKLITSSSGKYEVYDIAADPNELHDLTAAQESKATELGTELKAWVKTMPARPKQQVKLDGDAVQRLKSLGYVQ
ncbi:MAG: sulfatase-like hydrolase/transferase, partial [Bryobacteraceae bacterium]